MKSEQEIYHLTPGTVLQKRYVVGKAEEHYIFGQILYSAWDSVLEIRVLISEYYLHCVRVPGEAEVRILKTDPQEFYDGKRQFLNTPRMLKEFGDEPAVIKIQDYFEENQTAYMVMEYWGNITTLSEIIDNEGKMTEEEATVTLKSVMQALKVIHAAGIIYKGISPKNIFVSSGGAIKLIDFSASQKYKSEGGNDAIIITPAYSPVEQYDSAGKIRPWTDVYALGATMYRMITGVKPEESIERKMRDTLVPPKELNPSLSQGFSDVIIKAMAVDKRQRFKTVRKFEKALAAII